MFCSKCGNELISGAQYCPTCGERTSMQPASIALTSEALLTVKELTASPDGFSYKGNDFSYDKVASIGFGASHTNHYFGGPFSPTTIDVRVEPR